MNISGLFRIFSSILWLTISTAFGQTFQPANRNYILEFKPRYAYSEYEFLNSFHHAPVDSINRTISYVDGMGRPDQLVQWRSSPYRTDVIKMIPYDRYGYQYRDVLPFAGNSVTVSGQYQILPYEVLHSYYSDTSWDGIVVRTDHPFGERKYRRDPLGEVSEQGFPGSPWQTTGSAAVDAGHTVRLELGTNSNAQLEQVQLWNATLSGAVVSGQFPNGRLRMKVTRDENWVSGRAGTVEEYMDFWDRILLSRVWKDETTALDTYFIYDDAGNLVYVVPPGFNGISFTVNSMDFNELIYAYRYDRRKRVIEKKIPGKGWEHLVYNKNDQLVLSQDANQRAKTIREWSYTKYDAFGRVTETGILKSQNDRTSMAGILNAETSTTSTSFWETRLSGSPSYDNKSYPRDATRTVLVTNYYDDYGFNTNSSLGASVGLDSTIMVKGLQTGTKVARTDGTNPLLGINYYDKKGRLIESVSQNHLSGIDRVTNSYSFVGELLTSKRQHVPSVGATTTILTTNSYDHAGRLLETKKKVNEQPEVIQSKLSYNGIGQLKSKAQHSENGGTDFLNTINYTYNERGWTTGISSPQFTQQLKYHEPATGKQYNGNIAQQLWGYGPSTASTFTYTYDMLNRLINGTSTGTTVMGEELTYDEMWNIRTLKRETGLITSYSYDNGNRSNRLISLSGDITGSYQYDQNGNATMDRMSTVFTYNHLNLPQTATRTGTSVSYVYDAMGTKLTKNATVNGVIGRQDYVGGIEYSAPNVIERIATEEGYLLNSNGTYSYHYYLTDHLGNNRVVLKKGTSLTVPEIIQRQDYYPFGKTRSLVTSGNNRYLYNGKEVQKELGDQLDYGARFYDPEIGRWNVVDPLAENHYEVSAYAYVLNNPLGYTDPFGLDTLSANTDYIRAYREGVDVVAIDEVTVTRSLNVNEQSVDAVGQPGTAESLIPVWGSGRAAIDHFQHGNYGWAAFHTAMAVSDVFLVKSIATGLGKGAWKLGSHSWSATRKWMGKRGYAEAGQPIHHWAVPQATAKKYGIEGVTNQPWNLMTFPNQSLHMRAGHGMNYLGQPGYGTLGQFWYGTPTWFKAGVFSGGGRIID